MRMHWSQGCVRRQPAAQWRQRMLLSCVASGVSGSYHASWHCSRSCSCCGCFVIGCIVMRGIRSGLLLHVFRGLCVCFFLLSTTVGHTKTAESIDVSFRMWTHWGPRKQELGGGRIPQGMWHFWGSYLSYTELFSDNRLGDIIASLFDIAEDSDK